MNRHVSLLVMHGIGMTFGLLAQACSADDLSCKKKETMPGGEWTSVDLHLVVDEGKVTRINFHKVVSSGQPGGAYLCRVDSSTEANARWTHQGRSSVLSLPSSAREKASVVRITRSRDNYRVSFVGMSRDYCGFGAEFPQAVELRRGAKRCLSVD